MIDKLKSKDVEWVVNSLAELGVKIGDQFFFLYKGHSLSYVEDDPLKWRPVYKLEFGECCKPWQHLNDVHNRTTFPPDYSILDSDRSIWKRNSLTEKTKQKQSDKQLNLCPKCTGTGKRYTFEDGIWYMIECECQKIDTSK